MSATEYVQTVTELRELFPEMSGEQIAELADRAHGRTVIDPDRLEAAIHAYRVQTGLPYSSAHAHVTTAIVAYYRHTSGE